MSSQNPPTLKLLGLYQEFSGPACQQLPVCPIRINACGFETGMFLPGSFGKCLAGDEPSPCQAGDCEVEEQTWEESWGEISALLLLHLSGFVSFVLA